MHKLSRLPNPADLQRRSSNCTPRARSSSTIAIPTGQPAYEREMWSRRRCERRPKRRGDREMRRQERRPCCDDHWRPASPQTRDDGYGRLRQSRRRAAMGRDPRSTVLPSWAPVECERVAPLVPPVTARLSAVAASASGSAAATWSDSSPSASAAALLGPADHTATPPRHRGRRRLYPGRRYANMCS